MGYSLVKGIGDGEPIASERFSVGGHEWVRVCKHCWLGRLLQTRDMTTAALQVLLFYPDGKRSSSGEAAIPAVGLLGGGQPAPGAQQQPAQAQPGAPQPQQGQQPVPALQPGEGCCQDQGLSCQQHAWQAMLASSRTARAG